MTDHDKEEFAEVWSATYNLYSKQITLQTLALAFEALSHYDIQQIRNGLTGHIQSPEMGQFCPKPADVIKQIEGTGDDRAFTAWAKVLYGIHHVGAWSSIKFDDVLIHHVIEKIGGWVSLCKLKESELAFKQKDFISHYQCLLSKPISDHYPEILKGIIDCQQTASSKHIEYALLTDQNQITQHRYTQPNEMKLKELNQ
ncbi:hypothetical protein JQC92_21590 [Shewanella sp. 202IG2-18]|uniref:DUF6475 domain-containing protein n=1 Tax=Parashewanella hymeniacidonis TaxID=2807618 RepID=UPI001961AC27|nr:DUF6475 domain-containing protein [Parashewanella hymeniacidonis]MBM7074576.1 hypothetical protein [Parashewanella hymeniacidonis]